MADFDVNDLVGSIANAVNEALDNNQRVQVQNVEIYKDIKDMLSKLLTSNITTSKDLDKVAQTLNQKLKLVGGTTASADVIRSMVKEFKSSLGDTGSVATYRVLAELTQAIIAMRVASEKARTTGKGDEYFKVSYQKTAQKWDEEIAKSMGAQITKGIGARINQGLHGIIGFFGEDYLKKNLKGHKTIADSIVSGLASHKFIGGALTDGFRLLGLKIAAWTREKVPNGKYIAPIVFGIVESLGPILSYIIISKVITRMIPAIISGIGGNIIKFFSGKVLAKTAAGTATKAATQIGAQKVAQTAATKTATGTAGVFTSNGITYTTATQTSAQKVAQTAVSAGTKTATKAGFQVAAKKGLGKALPVVGVAMDAMDTVGAAKEGKTGAAVMSGIGAVAGIAALIAGLATPLGLILGGVSLVASLVGTWKRNSEESQRELNDNVYEIKKETLGDKIKEWLESLGSGGGNNSESGGSFGSGNVNTLSNNGSVGARGVAGSTKDYEGASLLKGIHKGPSNKHIDPNKMTHKDWVLADNLAPIYGSMGQILNLGSMTQRRASEVLAADIKAKGKESYYEIAPKEITRQGGFKTDAYDKASGGAFVARGTVDTFYKMKEDFRKRGYDVSDFVITGGIGTLGTEGKNVSPHTYTPGMPSHFGSSGTVIDVSVPKKGGKAPSQTLFNQILRAAGASVTGSGAYYEGDHYHLPMGELEAQKQVKAQLHDLTIKKVVEEGLTDEEREELAQRQAKNPRKSTEQHLRDMGFRTNTDVIGAPVYKENPNGPDEILTDYAGNVIYSRVRQIMGNYYLFSTDGKNF